MAFRQVKIQKLLHSLGGAALSNPSRGRGLDFFLSRIRHDSSAAYDGVFKANPEWHGYPINAAFPEYMIQNEDQNADLFLRALFVRSRAL